MTEPPDQDLALSELPPRLTLDDYEAEARERLSRMAYDYYAGGSGTESTLRENRAAFGRWVIRPRVLAAAAEVDLRTTILGQEVACPIVVAPTAFQRLAHPDGELATARAAGSLGTLMVLSTISTVSLEDVARTGVRRWFQLYVMRDRGLSAELVARAHAAGYGAVMLTVDTPLLGRRLRDERNRFDLPPGIEMANLPGVPLTKPDEPGSALAAYFGADHDATLSWRDLEWVRSLAPVPLVLKGVLTAEDARLAVEAGVDGIVISNHGGRQLDGAAASLDALPEVVEAAGDRVEVLMDGGVRSGSDALKALGLGARAVMVGRPVLWGLAVGGEDGVRSVLEMLRDDLALAMTLAGRASVGSIDRSVVGPAPR